jgi:mannose-6-phosphate isomerase class I
LNVPGDGFHLPAGVLHAPGTALTIEIQEPSDVAAVFQARIEGREIPKLWLYKDIAPAIWAKKREMAALEQLVWEINGEPYFYENRHTPPVRIDGSTQAGGFEELIYYNTTRFSGKRLVVSPGQQFRSRDKGAYNILVWQGAGRVEGLEVEGKKIGQDEVLVTHDRAINGVTFDNAGNTDLILLKFFGPDINDDVPFLPRYPADR